jgi:hypothetical protein
MTQVIMSTEGGYEVSEVEHGRVYRWKPGHIVLECECGERLTLTRSESTCPECCADHAGVIGAWLEAVGGGRKMKLYTLGATGTPPRMMGCLFRPDGSACLRVLLDMSSDTAGCRGMEGS